MEKKDYKINVKILPSRLRLEMELPSIATGIMVIECLLQNKKLNLPKLDERGSLLRYMLVSEGIGWGIDESKTIYEAGIRDGDTLILTTY